MKHDLDYMIAVMQAAKDGKEIEFRENSGAKTDWDSTELLLWDWYHEDYRIKPEPETQKQEYVPYENAVEFIDGQRKHGLYFTDQLRNNYYLPSCVSSNKNNIGVNGEGYYLTFETLLKNYAWQDGTPCGKPKQTS